MGEVGKRIPHALPERKGLARWKWQARNLSTLPNADTVDEWFFGQGVELPDGVAVGLLALDRLADNAIPAYSLLARISDPGTESDPSTEILLFGLDETDSTNRLRRAVSRAWRSAQIYADAYLDRDAAERRPFEVARTARADLPRAARLIEELEAVLMPSIRSVADWKYGKLSDILTSEVAEHLDGIRSAIGSALDFVDEQVGKKGLECDQEALQQSQASTSDLLAMDSSSRFWLASLKEANTKTDRWMDPYERGVVDLQDRVDALSALAHPTHVQASQLRECRRQLDHLSAFLASLTDENATTYRGSKNTRSDRWINTAEMAELVIQEQIGALGTLPHPTPSQTSKLRGRRRQLEIISSILAEQQDYLTKPDSRSTRPDAFLWLRLAEVYTVSFGRPAPLHGTDAPNTKVKHQQGEMRRSKPSAPTPTPQQQFTKFLSIVLQCVNWPDAMSMTFSDSLRHAKWQAGGQAAVGCLDRLLSHHAIFADELPSCSLVEKLGGWGDDV